MTSEKALEAKKIYMQLIGDRTASMIITVITRESHYNYDYELIQNYKVSNGELKIYQTIEEPSDMINSIRIDAFDLDDIDEIKITPVIRID